MTPHLIHTIGTVFLFVNAIGAVKCWRADRKALAIAFVVVGVYSAALAAWGRFG